MQKIHVKRGVFNKYTQKVYLNVNVKRGRGIASGGKKTERKNAKGFSKAELGKKTRRHTKKEKRSEKR